VYSLIYKLYDTHVVTRNIAYINSIVSQLATSSQGL